MVQPQRGQQAAAGEKQWVSDYAQQTVRFDCELAEIATK